MKNLRRNITLFLSMVLICTFSLTALLGCKDVSDDSGSGENTIPESQRVITFESFMNDVFNGHLGGTLEGKTKNTGEICGDVVYTPNVRDNIALAFSGDLTFESGKGKEKIPSSFLINENLELYSSNGAKINSTQNFDSSGIGSWKTEYKKGEGDYGRTKIIDELPEDTKKFIPILGEIKNWCESDFNKISVQYKKYLKESIKDELNHLFDELFEVIKENDGYAVVINKAGLDRILLAVANQPLSEVVDELFGKDTFKNIKGNVNTHLGRTLFEEIEKLKENGLDIEVLLASLDSLLVKITGDENMNVSKFISDLANFNPEIDILYEIDQVKDVKIADLIVKTAKLARDKKLIDKIKNTKISGAISAIANMENGEAFTLSVNEYFEKLSKTYIMSLIKDKNQGMVIPEKVSVDDIHDYFRKTLPGDFMFDFKALASKDGKIEHINIILKADGDEIKLNLQPEFTPKHDMTKVKKDVDGVYESFENLHKKMNSQWNVLDDADKKQFVFTKTTSTNSTISVTLSHKEQIYSIEEVCGGYSAEVMAMVAFDKDEPSSKRIKLFYDQNTQTIDIDTENNSKSSLSQKYAHDYGDKPVESFKKGEGCEEVEYEIYECKTCHHKKYVAKNKGHIGEVKYKVEYNDKKHDCTKGYLYEAVCDDCKNIAYSGRSSKGYHSTVIHLFYKIEHPENFDNYPYAVANVCPCGEAYSMLRYNKKSQDELILNGVTYTGEMVFICEKTDDDLHSVVAVFSYKNPSDNSTLTVKFYEDGQLKKEMALSSYVSIVG